VKHSIFRNPVITLNRLLGLAVCLSCALALIGCGDSDDKAPPASPGGSAGRGGSSGAPDASAGRGGGGSAGTGTGGASDAGAESAPDASSGGSAGDGGSSGSGGATGDSGSSDAGSIQVGSSGATISDASGTISLVIPAGALLGETAFTFTAVATIENLPSEFVLVAGTSFRIDWAGAGFVPDAKVKILFPTTQTLALAPDELQQGGGAGTATSCLGLHDAGPRDSYHWDAGPCSLPDNSGSGGNGGSTKQKGSATAGAVTPGPNAAPGFGGVVSNITAVVNTPVTFTVATKGAPPLRYQWRRSLGGTTLDIPGATSQSYTLQAVTASDNGAKFSLVVKNAFGDTATSNEGLLTIIQRPNPVRWNYPTTGLTDFRPGLDLPVVGEAGRVILAMWNDSGVLKTFAEGPAAGSFANFAQAARGRPLLLAPPNAIPGYVVFIDDDGTSGCSGTTGNQLSAVGWSYAQSNGTTVPLSGRIPLYKSANDCIESFSAGMVKGDSGVIAPSQVLDGGAFPIAPIVFALTETTAKQLKVGVGGASYTDPGSVGYWSIVSPVSLTLPMDRACSGSVFTQPSVMGALQAHGGNIGSPKTAAVLAWAARDPDATTVERIVLCSATLDNGAWTKGTVVFDEVANQPLGVIDAAGDALVFANRAVSGVDGGGVLEMAAGFRPAAGGAWRTASLGGGNGPAVPHAAFSRSGSAFAVWVTGAEALYAAHFSAAQAWEPTERLTSTDALNVGYPRICVDPNGNAVTLFAQAREQGDNVQPFSRQWAGGVWSDQSRLPDNDNEAVGASCARQTLGVQAPFDYGPFTVGRETDPTDPTKFKIVKY
jgi:hypothetical protein